MPTGCMPLPLMDAAAVLLLRRWTAVICTLCRYKRCSSAVRADLTLLSDQQYQHQKRRTCFAVSTAQLHFVYIACCQHLRPALLRPFGLMSWNGIDQSLAVDIGCWPVTWCMFVHCLSRPSV